jgi:hypothetical protein
LVGGLGLFERPGILIVPIDESQNISFKTLLAFRQEASAIRRERADLEARLAGLSGIRAETEKLLAESKKRIDGLLEVRDESRASCPNRPVH